MSGHILEPRDVGVVPSLRDANNRAAEAEAHVKRLQERVATLEREAVTLRADIKKAQLACAAMREKVAQMEDAAAAASAVVPPMPHVRTWKVGDVVSTSEEYNALPVGAVVAGAWKGPVEFMRHRTGFSTIGGVGEVNVSIDNMRFDRPRVIRSLPDSPRP
jgi:hypothetical protein